MNISSYHENALLTRILRIFHFLYLQCTEELRLIYEGNEEWLHTKAIVASSVLQKLYIYATMNVLLDTGGMQPLTQFRIILKGLHRVFPCKGNTKIDCIYLTQEGNKSIKKMIAGCKWPTFIECPIDGELMLVVGGEMIRSEPIPKTFALLGKKLVQYLSLYYTFNIKYPTGLESGFLMLQALIFGQKDILKADMKLSGLKNHLEHFNAHFDT